MTMVIFRLEDRKGVGPYHGERYTCFDTGTDGGRKPAPRDDGITAGGPFFGYHLKDGCDGNFGFASFDLLCAWFGLAELRDLAGCKEAKALGVATFLAHEWQTEKGKKQILFCRAHSLRIGFRALQPLLTFVQTPEEKTDGDK